MSKGLGNMLKQAQEMHSRISQLQESMAEKRVESSAGGGMVSVVMSGKQEVLSVKIADEIWEERDKELLEDLVVAAVNEGLNRSKEMLQEEMSKITGGLQLPFGM